MVGGVDHDRIFRQPALVQVVEEPADVFVDRVDAAQVVFHVSLIFPFQKLVAFELGFFESLVLGVVGCVPFGFLFGGQVARSPELQVIGGEVPGNGHGLVGCGGEPVLVVVAQGFRFGQVDPVVLVQVLRAGLPVAMGGLVLAHDEEGLVLVPSVLEPIKGDVGDDVGGITGDALYPIRCVHGRVVVRPLSLQDLPEIEPRGVALEVPFSDHGGLVAVLLQKLGKVCCSPSKRMPLVS